MSLILFFFFQAMLFAGEPLGLFEPAGPCPQKLKKNSFTLCYHPEHRLSLWAVHELSKSDIGGGTRRTNDYRADQEVSSAVQHTDYQGSGYDRGHLVPAADRKHSYSQMSETFLMTNMTPQHPSFNRGIWQSLERQLRKWVLERGDAIIITAPHLHRGLPLFRKGISLPEQHYKIIFWPKTKEVYAFLIANESPGKKSFEDFQVTIDEIEELTQLDFFSYLEDHEEDLIEGTLLSL